MRVSQSSKTSYNACKGQILLRYNSGVISSKINTKISDLVQPYPQGHRKNQNGGQRIRDKVYTAKYSKNSRVFSDMTHPIARFSSSLDFSWDKNIWLSDGFQISSQARKSVAKIIIKCM